MNAPLIGITPTPSSQQFVHGPFERYALVSSYSTAIEAAGGIPVILPPQRGHARNLLDRIDGLLLSGGGDIDPTLFGDELRHPKTYDVHALRDEFEFELTRTAIERDMPLFCICRGIQVLNVVLGGTLYQDIADQVPDALIHRQQEHDIRSSEPSHTVHLAESSLAQQIYGAASIETNSFHHQSIRDVSPDLRVTGTSTDGIIEAVERPGSGWLLGVQWHPEMMYRAHQEHLRPFQAFVAASARYRAEQLQASAASLA